MKMLVTVLAVFFFLGCATKAPKEDLRSVYQLIKERKFDEAESKIADSSSKSMLGQFDSYSGSAVKAVNDSGDYVFKKIQGAIQYCDKQLSEIKKANLDKSDDENQWDKFKLDEAANEFSRHCAETNESVVEAQNISSVDFKSMFGDMSQQFAREAKRISTKFSQDDERSEKEVADSAIAKENYEQSEEYYLKKLCEMSAIVDTANSILDKENDGAKVSGFVDKRRMYEAGQAVAINRKRIQHFSSEYKKKFSKSFKPESCK